MSDKLSILKIKKDVKSGIGRKVKIFYNGSRNRFEEYVGEITECYSNIFIVRLNESEVKSVSYVDVLTGVVQLKFL